MKFISTRGKAPIVGFCDCVLSGLASDGGLYLPQFWPQISETEIASFANKQFTQIAFAIISRFCEGEINNEILANIINKSYENFTHPSVTPIVEIAPSHFVLELFHGPTLAFKDVAMQFLARLMNHILSEQNKRATIIGATSGDTGSAAIEAFKEQDNIDIFILHPKDRTSEIQRRQMTTVLNKNVFNIAIKGNFDDCQKIVKDLFTDENFRTDFSLSGVNSINWGRILAQITYYFKAGADLGAPFREIDFCVPTGNFGDIFAGYAAKKMGLPIRHLIIATNENDILARAINNGRYEIAKVIPTSSPSMDIQISSNFERLLFLSLEKDAEQLCSLMNSLKQSGKFTLPQNALRRIRKDFLAKSATQEEVNKTIARIYDNSNYLIDPHTAVAINIAEKLKDDKCQIISLATAHPAKFPDAVKNASGKTPKLPAFLADILYKEEKMQILPNDANLVKNFIAQNSRAKNQQNQLRG